MTQILSTKGGFSNSTGRLANTCFSEKNFVRIMLLRRTRNAQSHESVGPIYRKGI